VRSSCAETSTAREEKVRKKRYQSGFPHAGGGRGEGTRSARDRRDEEGLAVLAVHLSCTQQFNNFPGTPKVVRVLDKAETTFAPKSITAITFAATPSTSVVEQIGIIVKINPESYAPRIAEARGHCRALATADMPCRPAENVAGQG